MPSPSGDPASGERLPVRSVPEAGESLQGYVGRAAAANGYERLDWVLLASGLPRSFASGRCDLGRLAGLLGRPAGELQGMATWPVPSRPGYVSFGATQVAKALVDFGRKRICTTCMASGEVHRRQWQLQPVLACTVHRSLLVDRCPRCGDHLGFLDLPIAGCPCGWMAADAAPIPAPTRLSEVADLIQRLEDGRPAPTGAAPSGSLDGALRLLWLATMSAVEERWRSAHMSKPDTAALEQLVEGAAGILLNWPAGLHAWLAARKRAGDGRVGIRAEFGPWLGRLAQVLRVNRCQVIADEARAWLAGNWGRGLLKPSSFFGSAGHRAGCLTAGEAASDLGVTPTSVARMIDAGQLEAEVCQMGGRTLRRVDPASVSRMKADIAATVGTAEVAARLGGTEHAIEGLRRLGLLRPVATRVGGRRVQRYYEAGIRAACEQLLAMAGPMVDPVANGVRLSDLTARRQVSFELVVRRIMTGEVRCWSTGVPAGKPILTRMVVRLPEIAGTSSTVDGTLSVKEAAKALQLSKRMIPVLVAAGCLCTSSARGARGLSKRSIDAAGVESFATKYILTRELASLKHTSTRSILALLRGAGIRPIVESKPGAGISAVWVREDVKCAASG